MNGTRVVVDEIQTDLDAILNNASLSIETHFAERFTAIDAIEFNVIDRIDGLLAAGIPPAELAELRQEAELAKNQLEAVDDRLFQCLRENTRRGANRGQGLNRLVSRYIRQGSGAALGQTESGYDALDMFINGLLFCQALPTPIKQREPGMIYYQQTPARVIFEMIDKANLTGDDVFCDIGSGLGHLPVLVNLAAGVKSIGIEFEPAYCDYAADCAADLNLPGVVFINGDARQADFSAGTVFFMYTPFMGRMLQDVLERLRQASRHRRITLFTYGSCTIEVVRQDWLSGPNPVEILTDKLGQFRSL